tara:strand:+ start:10445 stop:12025 length:1581 start_codon:yes stop_codon:yes gene_type:complete
MKTLEAPLKNSLAIDPVGFVKVMWPDVVLYDKQAEIMESVRDNDDTIVIAGNQLGKDFISGLISLWFFCSRRPARVVTSSVKFDQLNDVLWGEIRNFISTAARPLPIHYNHMKIRQVYNDGRYVDKSELVGQVVSTEEGLLGRHLALGPDGLPTTLVIFDECSGVEDGVWEKCSTWAKRRLAIGNAFDCENFFREAYKKGDIPRDPKDLSKGYHQKVIYITAEDSPNVKLARKEIKLGKKPSNRILVPGVKDWVTYQKHLKLWDIKLQTIGLKAQFYEGAEVKLFPQEWLKLAEEEAEKGKRNSNSIGVSMGIDVAEGGDSTVWTVVDYDGILEQVSMKTPDTSKIQDFSIALGIKWKVPADMWWFDRGGGGKQHADSLKRKGYNVKTVGFGEVATDPHKNRKSTVGFARKNERDDVRYTFKNRRAEMFGLIRYEFLDPIAQHYPFAIPAQYTKLTYQLSKFPLDYEEGKLILPPKNVLSDKAKSRGVKKTLVQLIGYSPDEADSFALACYGLIRKRSQKTLGKGL